MRRAVQFLAGISVVAVVASFARSIRNRGVIMFKQARFYTKGRTTAPIWIVIHTAETEEGPHVAENMGNYAANMTDGRQVSWHYVLDNDSTVQNVQEGDTAWAAGPGNSPGIHLELAGRASQTSDQWRDAYSSALLRNAAELVAEIARRHEIPIVHPTKEEVLAGKSGIVGHDQISWASQQAKARGIRALPWFKNGAWGTTNHTDPGKNFPWDEFLELVRSQTRI